MRTLVGFTLIICIALGSSRLPNLPESPVANVIPKNIPPRQTEAAWDFQIFYRTLHGAPELSRLPNPQTGYLWPDQSSNGHFVFTEDDLLSVTGGSRLNPMLSEWRMLA